MEDLKSIKINLRGLVITSSSAMTIEKLNEDYKEMMGNNIPFVKLGFETLEEFVCSLTDTFLVNSIFCCCFLNIILKVFFFFIDKRNKYKISCSTK